MLRKRDHIGWVKLSIVFDISVEKVKVYDTGVIGDDYNIKVQWIIET